MDKLQRRIYQPDKTTDFLLKGVSDEIGANISNFTNDAVKNWFIPVNALLRTETEFLLTRIQNGEDITEEELKSCLARCVKVLKDYPISDYRPLEQIMIHFRNTVWGAMRYDYILIVNDWYDEQLHRLNDILKTVDADFTLGTREFGERSRDIFKNWNSICEYSEIYTALSIIIECERVYYPLSVFHTILMIKQLDVAVQNSKLQPIKTPFETKITLKQEYNGLKYEILIYYTDNAYSVLSKDHGFNKMPQEIRDYYAKFRFFKTADDSIKQEDIDQLRELEAEGKKLFKNLAYNN